MKRGYIWVVHKVREVRNHFVVLEEKNKWQLLFYDVIIFICSTSAWMICKQKGSYIWERHFTYNRITNSAAFCAI